MASEDMLMIKFGIAVAVVLLVLGSLSFVVVAQSASPSHVVNTEFESGTLGRTYQYMIYLPAGYDDDAQAYPVIYLLHGRGDTMAAWLNVRSALDMMIAEGKIPPVIAVMPDMPSSDRGSYYVDSAYSGMLYRAESVETAFFSDLIPHIDSTYRTLGDRRSRIIGGYSMGGYGALRYALAHPDHFMGAIILSPAVYTPLPPTDSSTREFGAFGKDASLFDEAVYTRLNYPVLLEQFSGEHRLNLLIAVGDDEWRHPNPEDVEHDLDFEAHRFFNRAARVSGIAAEFRVYNGGHDWDVWQRGFEEGMRYLTSHLSTTLPEATNSDALDGWLTGTSGDDVAGGIAGVKSDESVYQVLGVQGSLDGQPHAGGMDIAVVKVGADRTIQWVRQLGTPATDRPYGVVITETQDIVVVGYTQGDFAETGSFGGDDIIVFKLNAGGELLWRRQLGTPQADRGYALALTQNDAVVIGGYTKGALAGPNAGDKDIITAKLTADGELQWIHQFGGDGEDKGQAVAVGPDDTIYSAGMTSSTLTPDASGGIDGFIVALSPTGDVLSLAQFGTPEWDEVTGIAVSEGHVFATGFTSGSLAGELAGDKDIYVMAFDAALVRIAADQLGSPLNDKGAAVIVLDDGSLIVAGYTDGSIGTAVGDFDLVIVRYSSDLARRQASQFGTAERDGADEWAEKNLFVSLSGERLLLSGLSLGGIANFSNQGGSDVFVFVVD